MKEIKIDLLPLISKLEAVLKKGFSRDMLAGNYQSTYKGKGMEFVGFREYVPSDDAMLIDWKASLKANRMMVRVLQEERNLTVFFLFDVSDNMLFSSTPKLKCEYAAELIGTMCFAMQQVGDSVGVGMFNEKAVKVIPPSVGKNQFYRIVRSLSNPSNYGGKGDVGYALQYLLNLGFLKQDAIVFVISDFIGVKPDFEKYIKLAGLKYDLTLIVVRDPVDMRLPDIEGEVKFSDTHMTQQLMVNPAETKSRYEAEAKAQIARIEKELNKTNSGLLLLETNQDFTGPLFKFFRMRQRYK